MGIDEGLLDELLKCNLNPWEHQFITSIQMIRRRGFHLSMKQKNKLQSTITKYYYRDTGV